MPGDGDQTERGARRAPRLGGRAETLRAGLERALVEAPATARDLSQRVGVPERDVASHLEHLARSLRHSGRRLVVEPASCLACGFVFEERRKLTRPGRCPECHARRISLPVFRIAAKGDAR